MELESNLWTQHQLCQIPTGNAIMFGAISNECLINVNMLCQDCANIFVTIHGGTTHIYKKIDLYLEFV
uniref:Uncharacterized protein n=1 Tax=Octopus bimaculoides TaxID=37653 RepID=A0A0L8I4S4_OCTBM